MKEVYMIVLMVVAKKHMQQLKFQQIMRDLYIEKCRRVRRKFWKLKTDLVVALLLYVAYLLFSQPFWDYIKNINLEMSYFPGVFITQYHKSRSGYFINHDLLINASPETRNKLIFYFIAQHTPQKLTTGDHLQYLRERNQRFGSSIMLWTYATFLGILVPTAAAVLKRRRSTAIRDIALLTALAGYSATVVNSTLWRTQQGRMLQSSPIISRLAQKYHFGTFDFALAKKQAHVQKLLEVYDANREISSDS